MQSGSHSWAGQSSEVGDVVGCPTGNAVAGAAVGAKLGWPVGAMVGATVGVSVGVAVVGVSVGVAVVGVSVGCGTKHVLFVAVSFVMPIHGSCCHALYLDPISGLNMKPPPPVPQGK
mmetsp:Transcript_34849/g.107868  ORF Transcript_34849/g.107868 Transcript_34849/m.107868 type:complete len:117 (-) Transcript_34849:1051-1401(-)